MDLSPFGSYIFPVALTRTVQSIRSPCLYTGSTSGPSCSVTPSPFLLDRPVVKNEDDKMVIKSEDDKFAWSFKNEVDGVIVKNEEEASIEAIDHYAETINSVVKNNVMKGESYVAIPKTTEEVITNCMSMKVEIKRKRKEKVKVKKRRLSASAALLAAPLIVNEQLSTNQSNGKDQMWWFVLKLLMDSANRDIVAWTGLHYSFRVIDKERFTRMWCLHNDRSRMIAWSSVCRAMRLCYGDKGILTPVSQLHCIWAFVVDISIPLKMSREAIQKFIVLHKDISPSPITFPVKKVCTKLEKVGNNESSMVKQNVHFLPSLDSMLTTFSQSELLPTLPSPRILSSFFLNDVLMKEPIVSPLPSPYWLPVPFTPEFSSYFSF